MSEPMALELLVEHCLSLDGYWTQARVPFQTGKKKGANSDLDILAVARLASKDPRVVVVEVKGHGRPEDYANYSNAGRQEELKQLLRNARKRVKQFRYSI